MSVLTTTPTTHKSEPSRFPHVRFNHYLYYNLTGDASAGYIRAGIDFATTLNLDYWYSIREILFHSTDIQYNESQYKVAGVSRDFVDGITLIQSGEFSNLIIPSALEMPIKCKAYHYTGGTLYTATPLENMNKINIYLGKPTHDAFGTPPTLYLRYPTNTNTKLYKFYFHIIEYKYPLL